MRCHWLLLSGALLLASGLPSCSGSPDTGTVDDDAPTPDTDALNSLPYVGSIEMTPQDAERIEVTRHNPFRALAGVNVYCSERTEVVHLFDMHGKTLHEFRVPDAQCMLLRPLDTEDFVLLGWDRLFRIDWDSNVKWRRELGFHHDLDVAPDTTIYALIATARQYAFEGVEIPVFDDSIALIDPDDGRVRREVPLFPILEPLVPRVKLIELARLAREGEPPTAKWNNLTDMLHTNSLEVLDRDIGVASAGQVLVCMRSINSIAIVDVRTRELVWHWGAGALESPHHARVLPNGHIQVFDNGVGRGSSRIVEVDPSSGQVVWQYPSDGSRFYSATRGSAQRLSNGNLLVSETDTGRVFEVDSSQSIVWEFWNPDLRYQNRRLPDGRIVPANKRLLIYRIERITDDSWGQPRIAELVDRVRAPSAAAGLR